MKISPVFILVFILTTVLARQAGAVKPAGFLGLSVGRYDIFHRDDGQSADFRVEYRPDLPLFIKAFKPWAGLELTPDGTLWAGGGLLADIRLTDHVFLTPGFGAGYYNQGQNHLDLGFPLLFRSQLELGYQLDSGERIALSFSHLSHCGLGDDNPGAEIVNLSYLIPLDRLFSGLSL
ncbi:MAG: acyloxyacyl hydrolase [Alphaproteobacteria bacterium]|nr:acyloxyacyl hydrolase [Alphaproteobacteria bacterium]